MGETWRPCPEAACGLAGSSRQAASGGKEIAGTDSLGRGLGRRRRTGRLLLLAGRRRRDCRLALEFALLQPGRLADQLALVVQLGPAHLAAALHFDLGNARRIQREDAL